MTRKRDRERRPARSKGTKLAKKRILVVCEGKRTEIEYLDGYKMWRRNTACDVVVVGQGQDPKNVVKRAKRDLLQATKMARFDRDRSAPYDEVWCVFDRDSHTRFEEACSMAEDNDFKLAVSIPCFELWLLLHHQEQPGMQERGDIASMLSRHTGLKSKGIDFERDCKERYPEALMRARKLAETAEEDGEPFRNPTTGFYKLTESIVDACE